MQADSILVVDDEPQIRRVVRHALAGQGMRMIEAATGSDAIDLAAAELPKLIILDLGLPDMSGEDVCREIRSWSPSPMLVLSARHSDAEKVALLDAGADDYMTKPFSTIELQARVRALLRRAAAVPVAGSRAEVGGLVMDFGMRTLTRDGQLVHLTPTEWELLRTLITQPGRTLTHRQLFTAVWGSRSAGDAQQYLRVYIAQLRRKIEDDSMRPRYIITEPGVGYRFGVVP